MSERPSGGPVQAIIRFFIATGSRGHSRGVGACVVVPRNGARPSRAEVPGSLLVDQALLCTLQCIHGLQVKCKVDSVMSFLNRARPSRAEGVGLLFVHQACNAPSRYS